MPRFSSRRPGITLTEVVVAIAIIAVLAAILVPAVQKVRAMAALTDCKNNLKQVALAVHSFHSHQNQFPAALSMNTTDAWYLSWMGRVLPHLDQGQLGQSVDAEYQRIYSPWGNFWAADWGGQPPHMGFSTALQVLRCPADGRPMVANLELGTGNFVDAGFTSYLGVHGSDGASGDGVFIVNGRVTLAAITDGASNTVMIGERPPYQRWWYGTWYAGAGYDGRGTGDVVLGANNVDFAAVMGCPPNKVGLQVGGLDVSCDLPHFWSMHSSGANFAFADGSVRFLNYSANANLAALVTRAGGEPVPEN